MGNALNFRFSRPHYRFHVVCIGHELFSAHAATANLACYIVSCGRCRVGSVSLLLFPSLASAMTAGAASIERDDDIISPVQNPENQAPPISPIALSSRPAAEGPLRTPSIRIESFPNLLSGEPLSAIAAPAPYL